MKTKLINWYPGYIPPGLSVHVKAPVALDSTISNFLFGTLDKILGVKLKRVKLAMNVECHTFLAGTSEEQEGPSHTRFRSESSQPSSQRHAKTRDQILRGRQKRIQQEDGLRPRPASRSWACH